jgi:XTP/dITP diphosphohydrolase
LIVLLATKNRGKLRELSALFGGSQLDVKLPEDVGAKMPEVKEDGNTFKENAVKKATALAAASGQWALADDSGLEVEILGGAPGVRSARFAGPYAGDEANTRKLLKILRSARNRKAKFRCVLALAKPTGEVLTADGFLEGEIGKTPLGEGGFGYDPVFYLVGRTITVAMISFDEKQRISHRAKAAQKLLSLLPKFLT